MAKSPRFSAKSKSKTTVRSFPSVAVGKRVNIGQLPPSPKAYLGPDNTAFGDRNNPFAGKKNVFGPQQFENDPQNQPVAKSNPTFDNFQKKKRKTPFYGY